MPLVPSLRERIVYLYRNAGPAPMIDLLAAWGFRVGMVAFRVGLFDALSDGPASSDEIAQRTELDPRGSALLLDSLECLGWVKRRRDGRYRATRMTRRWAPVMAGGVPYFEKIVFDDFSHLERMLFDGNGRHDHWDQADWDLFQAGQLSLAKMNVAEVVRRVDIPRPAERLLDLGGGHGLYSAELCRRYPTLHAVVFDQPEMAPVVQNLAKSAGLTDRLEFRGGNFFTDPCDDGYQAVLLFNVLHAKTRDECRQLIERAHAALVPGGIVVVLDQFPERGWSPVARAFGSLMALSMFNNVGNETYTSTEITDWLREAGFDRTRFRQLHRAPGNALLTGRKA